VSLDRVGRTARLRGETARALACYNELVTTGRRFLELFPADSAWARQMRELLPRFESTVAELMGATA
jgi:hypothetical protein